MPVRDREAPGSNPGPPTSLGTQNERIRRFPGSRRVTAVSLISESTPGRGRERCLSKADLNSVACLTRATEAIFQRM